jgi:hypothetical protein
MVWATLAGLAASPARAEWTINAGYHNPVVSDWGLNLFYWGSKCGFETGVGYVNAHSETTTNAQGEKETKSTTFTAAGDVDIKFLLASSGVRPYLQGGFAVGLGAKTGSAGGAGAGVGGGFAGLGLLFGSPGLYAYCSFNLDGARDGFLQAGLGTSL